MLAIIGEERALIQTPRKRQRKWKETQEMERRKRQRKWNGHKLLYLQIFLLYFTLRKWNGHKLLYLQKVLLYFTLRISYLFFYLTFYRFTATIQEAGRRGFPNAERKERKMSGHRLVLQLFLLYSLYSLVSSSCLNFTFAMQKM